MYPTITPLPDAPVRGDTRAVFTAKYNARFAAEQAWTDQINAAGAFIETKASEVDTNTTTTLAARDTTLTARDTTLGYRNEAETFKDQAEAAIAVIPAGTIDDLLIAPDKAWSSQKLDNGYARTPSVLSPLNNATGLTLAITIEGTPFAPAYSVDGRDYREIQIQESGGSWGALVVDEQVSTDDYTFNADPTTAYDVRIRDKPVGLPVTAWSAVVTFTTADTYIEAPTNISPADNAVDIEEQPTLEASAFSVFNGTDTHINSRFRVFETATQMLVHDSGIIPATTTYQIPPGILQEGEVAYEWDAQYEGDLLGWSGHSVKTSFTTLLVFFVYGPESAGLPHEGGYYAGANIVVGGITYAVIVAPKSQGGETSATWEWTTDPDVPAASSTNDGKSNTTAILAAGGDGTGVAADFCDKLSVNGFDDWHLPSPDELEICYRYLKPTTQGNYTSTVTLHSAVNGTNPNSDPIGAGYTTTNPAQTSVSIFQMGGSEAFATAYYWSSMQSSAGFAWVQGFSDGYQVTVNKSNTHSVRAVRWVEVN